MVPLGYGAGAQIEGDKQGTTAFGELLCIGLISLPVLFFFFPPSLLPLSFPHFLLLLPFCFFILSFI